MEIKNKHYFKDRNQWRQWLKTNHSSYNEVWLIYYKKHTGKVRIPYEDAVEEAICFGWIDSTVKRLDDERYIQKFTPRRDKSSWSKINKQRASVLIKNGKMTEAGLLKIREAKNSGKWNEDTAPNKNFKMPKILQQSLAKNKNAKINFDKLSPSHKKQYIIWITSAKKEETKVRRTSEAITLLNNNQKLGMK